MVVDFYVPLDSAGQPVFDPVWTYMLTSNSALGVNETYNDSKQVNVFPNPANEKVWIELPENFSHSEVNVFNCLGQQVLSEHYTNQSKVSLNISHLPSGFYYVRIGGDNHSIFNKRLIIKK